MPKLTIDTRKSDYSPIIVNINGTDFTVRDFDKATIRELNKYDRIVEEGDLEAPYERLAYLLKLRKDHAAISKLLAREVNRITVWIIRAAYSADAAEMENLSPAEKKKKSNGVKDRKQ
jgi:hypothetical protein